MTNTLMELQTETRELMDLTNFFVPIESEHEKMREAHSMARLWQCHIKSTSGVKPSENDFLYTKEVFYYWQQTSTIARPVIVAAPPAFGKSTMLSVFLRRMCMLKPDSFSAIVVKERVEDVEAIVKEINSGIIGGKYAYGIRGFDEEVITREEYDDQFSEFIFYNVVVMTTKQFELQTLKKKLSNFTPFTNAYGRDNPRRLLLIDEKPSLVINHGLTTREVSNFLSDVQQASYARNGKLQPYYAKTYEIVTEMRAILESGEDMPARKFPALRPGYRVPRQMERDYAQVHGHAQMSLLRAFERIASYGGMYDLKNGIGTVTTTQVVHYQYTLFNTFILDGTGTKDPDYITSDFYLSTPSEMPTYQNVTFHVCDSYSLSRTALASKPEELHNVAEMIKEIVKKKATPTLVVTYKSHKDALAKLLEGENVIMKHFDGGRGSNAYTAADTAIYVGNLFKGSSYYSATTSAVAGDRLGIEISGEYDSNKAHGIVFRDEIVNEYRDIDMAVNMVQETNRLRASRKTQAVDIYVFNKTGAMLTHLVDAYPGADVQKFQPVQRLTGKETSADALIKYFMDMPVGSSVKGSSIQRALNIHRNTFGKEIATERVVEAMRIYGIIKEKTRFIKV